MSLRTGSPQARWGVIAIAAAGVCVIGAQSFAQSHPAPVDEMIAAGTDVWGEAAMRQPDGPTYVFFRDLLPPLRYVNADFRHYPIALSAPRSTHKCRFVSNGSGVNLLANKKPMWSEMGRPVKFCVGRPAELFGAAPARLAGPTLLDGWLPVVNLTYRVQGVAYRQEAFAPVDPVYADAGAVMVGFRAVDGEGRVEVRIDPGPPLHVKDGALLNQDDRALIAFSPDWQWQPEDRTLWTSARGDASAVLTIFTEPADSPPPMSGEAHAAQRERCIRAWTDIAAEGAAIEIPEPMVQNAWRATLAGNFMIADGDRMNYSTGNAYAKLYQGECGDALCSLLLFGHRETARTMLRPIMEFYREATRFHVAGHKLQLLAYYYWITRDAEAVRANEDIWRKSVDLILSNLEAETGLLPADNYAGDISQQVHSLNSNANCWRGLRDMAAVLDEIGDQDEARRLQDVAPGYRKSILAAVAKSERLDTRPPFIPIALLADEPAHDPITATRIGSYYDLMAPYVLGSGVFGHGDKREDWLLGYLQAHGGVSMGMMRTEPHQGEFNGYHGVVPLYGLRYLLTLLRRDEPQRALVGFYGHLAQGMAPDTFVGGEGTRFLHGDERGRTMYLPPNSASNAAFLITLRYLLIQDWDLDDDGRPETLRLLYGIPQQWLEDGRRIVARDAPTAFGAISFEVESNLSAGRVTVRVTPPARRPRSFRLRFPLPRAWKTSGARLGDSELSILPDGAVELPPDSGTVVVTFSIVADRG